MKQRKSNFGRNVVITILALYGWHYCTPQKNNLQPQSISVTTIKDAYSNASNYHGDTVVLIGKVEAPQFYFLGGTYRLVDLEQEYYNINVISFSPPRPAGTKVKVTGVLRVLSSGSEGTSLVFTEIKVEDFEETADTNEFKYF